MSEVCVLTLHRVLSIKCGSNNSGTGINLLMDSGRVGKKSISIITDLNLAPRLIVLIQVFVLLRISHARIILIFCIVNKDNIL